MTAIRARPHGRAERVPNAVGEEGAVREIGDRIVEGLVRELLLEGPALADVAAVEHDPAHVLVLEQLRVLHLELEPTAVAMLQGALEGVRLRSDCGSARDDPVEPRPVGFRQEAVEARRLDLLDGVAEQARDRRALIGDDPALVEHGDQVARMRDERAEARLALLAVHVLRERRGVDARARPATRETRASRRRRARSRVGVWITSAPCSMSRTERRTTIVVAASPRPSAASARSDGVAKARCSPGTIQEWIQSAASSEIAQLPAPFDAATRLPSASQSTRRTFENGPTIFAAAAATSSFTVARPTASTSVRPASRRASSRPVRTLLLADETCHAQHDEQEQDRRRADDHEQIGVPDVLDEVDCGRDQAGEREQAEPRRREARPGVLCRLLEGPHRRVQRGGAPEHEVGDPARVVEELVVVRACEQRVVVGAVGAEQRNRARAEQVERRRLQSRLDREPDQRREQEHVPERVCDRDQLRQDRQARQVDVRGDEEHPREQSAANREDERVDHRGTVVAASAAAPHEQHQADEQQRIDAQIDRVAGRREADGAAEQIGVRVRVEVAGHVQELPDEEQSPGEAGLRPVQPHADRDRERRRDTDHVDHDGVALERRHEEVGAGQHNHRGQVPEPDRRRPQPHAGEDAHAATSTAGCSSNVRASRPSTSQRRSISASVFALVSWMRKPTSLRGTSGYAASVT